MTEIDDLRRQIIELPAEQRAQIVSWLLSDPTARASRGIETTAGVCGGEARIVRTRIPVWVLEKMRQLGETEAEILRCYPTLLAEDLVNAWDYVENHRQEIDEQIANNEGA